MIEQFPTDTVDYADIVLPATMQTEHLDVNDGYGHMYVSLNRPAVAPPGECLPATETFRRLARAMGLDEPLLYDDDETLCAHAARRRATSSGCGTRAGCGSSTAAVRAVHGRLPDPVGQARVLRRSRARADGHDPLPGLHAAGADRRRGHPLALIAPASHWFLNTVFANKPDLMKRAGEPRIDAAPGRRGRPRAQQTATLARVFNARGSFLAEVEVSDRVRPGVIASTKGHWLKHVRGGANVNATVEERDADMGGGAIFHDNRVEVEHALHQPGDPGSPSRPSGEPEPSNFELAEVEVADPGDGELVVRNTFMSVDPYMRGRMNEAQVLRRRRTRSASRSTAAPSARSSRRAPTASPRATSSCTSSAGASTRELPAKRARKVDAPGVPPPRTSACSGCPA